MNKILILAVTLLSISATGARALQGAPTVEDGDVWMGNHLPEWGEVCTSADVRGGPELFYPVLYVLEKGARVRLHELSNPTGEWVSIAAAQWMPLKNLCW